MLNNTADAFYFEKAEKVAALNVTPISKLYVPQNNGEISPSIMQNWTQQATKCYEIQSDCSKCSLCGGNYSFICQMPKIVKALLKTYGPPQNLHNGGEQF